MMRVFIERSNEKKDVTASSVKELLVALKINPTTVLVVKNNELVTEDAALKNTDEIKLLSVISSG